MDVTTFDPRFAAAFTALNRQWIEQHFRLEPLDLAQLEDPDAIRSAGGEIFFVVEDGKALGTCAMIPHGADEFELAKMAVAVSARGRGYGDVLMETALAWARSRGAARVVLLSNTILAPAIALYHKHGFRTSHLGPHPDYERCNIEMRLDL